MDTDWCFRGASLEARHTSDFGGSAVGIVAQSDDEDADPSFAICLKDTLTAIPQLAEAGRGTSGCKVQVKEDTWPDMEGGRNEERQGERHGKDEEETKQNGSKG